MILISTSLLAADFSKIKEELESVKNADYLHVDVMDGKFVENTTLFLDVANVKKIKQHSEIQFLTHLMVEHPLDYIKKYAEAGSSVISFHIEAKDDPDSVIEEIRKYNCGVSIAINPDTPVSVVEEYLNEIDHVLVMSVVPGKGGQQYIDHSTGKILHLKHEISKRNLHVLIEVDGGIKLENAHLPVNAGADIIVSGTGIFSQKNRMEVIDKMKDVILLGADHAGYQLKEAVKKYLDKKKIAYQDFGTNSEESTDYPLYAQKVAKQISQGKAKKGILICGTGQGMAVAANRFKGVRAALCLDTYYAEQAREHGDSNVLCLAGRVTKPKDAEMIIEKWLETPFSEEEKRIRRLKQIDAVQE